MLSTPSSSAASQAASSAWMSVCWGRIWTPTLNRAIGSIPHSMRVMCCTCPPHHMPAPHRSHLGGRGCRGSAARRSGGGMLQEDERRQRLLLEVEGGQQVSELGRVLADARPRVGAAVGPGVEALALEEQVFDELVVGVEAE